MTLVYIAIGIVVILVILILIERATPSDVPKNISDADIRQFAQQGQKIRAIKCYRILYGVGLKEAKEAVEDMMREP